MESALASLLVALVSAIIGAVVAIEVKHSSSTGDVYARLRKLGIKTVYWLWIAFLFYSIALFAISEEPLTRLSVTSFVVTCCSVVALAVFGFLERLVSIIERMHDVQEKHVAITKDVIQGIPRE